MWKKRLFVIAGMILAIGAISAVAFAQDGDTGKVDIEGRGALWAHGTGSVDLDVRHGRVQMQLSGDITITGPAGLDVRINGDAQPRIEGGQTVIVLSDFDGTIGVRGTDFTIDAEGDVKLRGRGAGSATLVGEGRWRTLHDSGTWDGVERALPA